MHEANPTDLRNQEHAIAERKKVLDWKTELRDRDFLWLMGSETGRRNVWRWVDDSGFAGDAFSANNSVMSNAVGRQAHGRALYADAMRLCPELWVLMHEENDGRHSDQ